MRRNDLFDCLVLALFVGAVLAAVTWLCLTGAG